MSETDLTSELDQDNTLGPSLSFGVQSAYQVISHLQGSEGRVDIKIVNQLDSDIDIHFMGGGNKEVRETLLKGMTRYFSKKPSDSKVKKTTCYECEIWAQNKHARLFVYGFKAPRKNNRFDVRENGIYLIEKRGEFLVYKWEIDMIDKQVNNPVQTEPSLLNSLNKLF